MTGSLVLCLLLAVVYLPSINAHCNFPLGQIACFLKPSTYVCGSDGKIYKNECELCEAATKGHPVILAHHGPCRNDTGHYTPSCPECPYQQYNPVCGSDRRTYDNVCELEKKACISDKYIKVAKYGPCYGDSHHGGSQGGQQCDSYRQCHPSDGPPVCASNGLDYWTRCDLEKVTCIDPKIYEVRCPGVPPPYPGGHHGSGHNPHQRPPGPPHPGRPHPGRPHPGRPHPGRPHPGIPHPGIPHPGLPHPGGPVGPYDRPTTRRPYENIQKPHITLPNTYDKPKPHITLPGGSDGHASHGVHGNLQPGTHGDAHKDFPLRSALGGQVEVEEVEEEEEVEASLENSST